MIANVSYLCTAALTIIKDKQKTILLLNSPNAHKKV